MATPRSKSTKGFGRLRSRLKRNCSTAALSHFTPTLLKIASYTDKGLFVTLIYQSLDYQKIGGGSKQGDVLKFSKWIYVLKVQLVHRKQSVSAWGR